MAFELHINLTPSLPVCLSVSVCVHVYVIRADTPQHASYTGGQWKEHADLLLPSILGAVNGCPPLG